ncbi:hypothetical protein ITX34_15840, partial [Streptomyces bryophytorum]|nr:hypothetical protein [Actinacidiphila bryophytorum]
GKKRSGGTPATAGPTAAGHVRAVLPRLPEVPPGRPAVTRTPGPAVHIGTVEVRVAAPVPTPVPAPAPGPSAPVRGTAGQQRLYRPAATFGLGQG